jgi:SSS family solute:Na+ symporter/sodium/pantothenate symporter
MRYLELIADRPLVWALFGLYLVATSWLAWLGHRKTGDMKTFAIGSGDMNPMIVGITLAASIASTATFVINPGFVYVHGVSALLHLGGAVTLGIVAGLLIMSVGFRKLGVSKGAITLPQWLGERYGSKAVSTFFALVSLLSLCFVVLIVGGLSIVMQQTLGLTNTESLVLIIGFVFGYVFIGGTYAHAYTNTLQGIIMVVIAAVIVGSGIPYFFGEGGGIVKALAAADPNLLEPVNPASNLFNSYFSVYVSGFIIGFAVVCQPHIMTKALYVKDDRALYKSLAVSIAVGLVFTGLLLVGLYAHVADIPASALLDPATGQFRQDRVMAAYIAHSFSPTMIAIITVALMAAGMSTLDGILVSLSSIAANDLFLNVAERRWLAGRSADEKSHIAHRASQLILIAMGVAAFVIALHPPKLLGIFGQLGVYGIVAASAVPILFGILIPSLGKITALTCAITALAVHFGLYFGEVSANPGVTATWGILASCAVVFGSVVLTAVRRRSGALLLSRRSGSTTASARARAGA